MSIAKRRRLDDVEAPAASNASSSRLFQSRCPLCDSEDPLMPSDDPSSALFCTNCGYIQEQTEFQRERGGDRFNAGLNTVWAVNDPLQQLSARLRSMASYRTGFHHPMQGLSKEEGREIRSVDHIKRIRSMLKQVLEKTDRSFPRNMLERTMLLFTSVRSRVIRAKDAARERRDLLSEPVETGRDTGPGADSIASANVRWGAPSEALAVAALAATFHKVGMSCDIDAVATRCKVDARLARTQFYLICRCIPDRHKATDLLDPRLAFDRIFARLEELQPQLRGTGPAKRTADQLLLSTSLRRVLAGVDIGRARTLANALAEVIPLSVSSGEADGSVGRRLDPHSSAIALTMLALEGTSVSAISPRGEFTRLSQVLLAGTDGRIGDEPRTLSDAPDDWQTVLRKYEKMLHYLRTQAASVPWLFDMRAKSTRAERARTKRQNAKLDGGTLESTVQDNKLTRAQLVAKLQDLIAVKVASLRKERQAALEPVPGRAALLVERAEAESVRMLSRTQWQNRNRAHIAGLPLSGASQDPGRTQAATVGQTKGEASGRRRDFPDIELSHASRLPVSDMHLLDELDDALLDRILFSDGEMDTYLRPNADEPAIQGMKVGVGDWTEYGTDSRGGSATSLDAVASTALAFGFFEDFDEFSE